MAVQEERKYRQKELDELEGRAKWADAADNAACTEVKALLEPCASAIRATAQAFKSEEQMQELHAIVEAQAERRFRQNFQQRSIVGWDQVLNDR